MRKFTICNNTISIIVLCLFFTLISSVSFSADLYSICNAGNWSEPNCWSYTPGGPPCNCIPISSDNVYIETDMILDMHLTGGNGVSGSLNIAAGVYLFTTIYDVEIKNGGVLNVYGKLDCRNLTWANSSSAYIANGAVVTVHGNFSNNNNSSNITIDGSLIVYGNFYNGNGGVISGSGLITIEGEYSGAGNTFDCLSDCCTSSPCTLSSVLPIELVSFSAKTERNGILLTWITASEINNDFFTIEKTKNGADFELVTKIEGAGNSNNSLNYEAIDTNPYSGLTYYRLKQTDFDGKQFFSELISVEAKTNNLKLNAFPNPLKQGDVLNLNLNFKEQREVLVVLSDMFGREHYSKVIILDQNTTTLVMDPAKNLPAGIYNVTGSSDNFLSTKRIIVQ